MLNPASPSKVRTVIQLLDATPAFWTALRAVGEHLQTQLYVETPFVTVGNAKSVDPERLFRSIAEPCALARTNRMQHFTFQEEKWRIHHVYDRVVTKTQNTPANKFLVYFIRYSIKITKDCTVLVPPTETETLATLHKISHKLTAFLQQLPTELLNQPLTPPSEHSHFLQFDPHYRILLSTFLSLKNI